MGDSSESGLGKQMSCVQVAASASHLPPPNSKHHLRKQAIHLLERCGNVHQIAPIHANILKLGRGRDDFVLFELFRACSRCGAIDYALRIFEQIRDPNVYLHTALIDGLVLSGLYEQGIVAYVRMIENSVWPDDYAVVSVLKACTFALSLMMGKGIHAQAMKLGLNFRRQVWLKLIEMYGKCGDFEGMQKVFDQMPEPDTVATTVVISSYFDHQLVDMACDVFESRQQAKDTVCWTAMIDGLVQNGEMNKALDCFRQMQREGVSANEVTAVCVLSACAKLGALELGKWVHSYVEKYGIEVNHFVGSALVNMYSRCGIIEEAERVFEGMKEKEVSAYNSMISGYALNGKSAEAIEMFERMIKGGTRPTSITFVSVLNACSHGGLVHLGLQIFQSMQRDYGVEPQVEHYGCMVDLLGRAGQIEEAYDFIQKMRIPPDHLIWGSLLSACKVHRCYELGKRVADILFNHGFADIGSYVLISNFYSSWGKWQEALLARAKLKEGGLEKEPGCSFIEVNNEIHEFLLGDIRHPEKKAIYRNLEGLEQKLRVEGYSPQADVVLQDISDQDKEQALAIHSERLALSYGLISTAPHTSLRIFKNLRICDDCHGMIKLVSKVTLRRIIVRDRNRFHHFENGGCSCGDYW